MKVSSFKENDGIVGVSRKRVLDKEGGGDKNDVVEDAPKRQRMLQDPMDSENQMTMSNISLFGTKSRSLGTNLGAKSSRRKIWKGTKLDSIRFI